MPIQALGYAGFGSSALDDWRQFGTGLVGLQAVERGNSLLAFRMDDRKQRIVIDRAMPDGARFFGWEVADAADLEALAARLERAGVAVTAEPRALADARRVRGLISFGDPAGNRLEAFYGAEIDDTPFRPGRSISGFRTGPLGLGHAVLTVENIDPMMAFYVDVLGFGLSRLHPKTVPRLFLPRQRAAPQPRDDRDRQERHASSDGGIVLARRCRAGLRHRLDPAGSRQRHARPPHQRFHDLVLRQVAVVLHDRMRLGRPRDRSGNWQPVEMFDGPSLWGHERVWLPPDDREVAREMRMRAAAEGRRAPVQVMEGNYQLMPGTCAWWDGVSGKS